MIARGPGQRGDPVCRAPTSASTSRRTAAKTWNVLGAQPAVRLRARHRHPPARPDDCRRHARARHVGDGRRSRCRRPKR
ncbi:MAG: hypothetical protein MZW92_07490 [Comamonadaceae bacterium]|nr:hypothetical protein [Comamonadaceae bacterium]